MSEVVYSTFMVELDCLVDTRFSLLTTYGEEVFQNAFSEEYYTRPIDQFPGIDPEDFKERYKKRNKSILKNATGTPIVQMLNEFCKETLKLIESSPFHRIPKILINVYPYNLTDEEKVILLNSFSVLTDEKAIVELVYLSKEEITPIFVRDELSILMMYEYYEWLEIHSANDNLKRVTCPSVTMLGPAIYFKGLPTAKDIQAEKEAKMSGFKAMEITASPLIGLKLMPIDLFSLALKLKRHKPT